MALKRFNCYEKIIFHFQATLHQSSRLSKTIFIWNVMHKINFIRNIFPWKTRNLWNKGSVCLESVVFMKQCFLAIFFQSIMRSIFLDSTKFGILELTFIINFGLHNIKIRQDRFLHQIWQNWYRNVSTVKHYE